MPPPSSSIEISGLTFAWKGEEFVCRDVDLRIPKGSAYGLLGPNGVGKSTLFKLMLGLLPPAAGQVRLLGEPVAAKWLPAFARIGSLIESPQFYPHLSGRDNLATVAGYRRLPSRRIDEVLRITGLGKAADRRVRHYSTGMKQRLGIARALLPTPELLILDEPTNGLDPEGIAEIRRLLRRLHREEGCTLLISSHILSEIEQICTHTAILCKGRIAFQGKIEDLIRHPEEQSYVTDVDRPEAALAVLQRAGFRVSRLEDATLRLLVRDTTALNRAIDQLRSNDIAVLQLIREANQLEAAYLKILSA